MRLFKRKSRFTSVFLSSDKIKSCLYFAASLFVFTVFISFGISKNKFPSDCESIISSAYPASPSDMTAVRGINHLKDIYRLSPDMIIAGKKVTPQAESDPQIENAESINTASQSEDAPSSPIIETFQISGSNKNTYTSDSKIYLSNETSNIIKVSDYLNKAPDISVQKGSPCVLIVHTHTTEAYTEEGASSDSTRSLDSEKNVISIGNVFEQVLTENGIGVIHDKTVNDYPSYNGSYTKTLSVIEKNLAEHPSLSIVLDIHRDAMQKSDGTKYKLCANINGEKVSQVMIVAGTDEGGLSHPNWQSNLAFAMRIQKKLADKYEGFARPLNLRRERFNQHATGGSLIIEVGTDANTLEESKRAASYAALAISEVINEL